MSSYKKGKHRHRPALGDTIWFTTSVWMPLLTEAVDSWTYHLGSTLEHVKPEPVAPEGIAGVFVTMGCFVGSPLSQLHTLQQWR